MKNKEEIISSGILEEYVLGILSDAENKQVHAYFKAFPDLKDHVNDLEDSLLKLAHENAVPAPPGVKRQLMNKVKADYSLTDVHHSKDSSNNWYKVAAIMLGFSTLALTFLYQNTSSSLKQSKAEMIVLEKNCEDQKRASDRTKDLLVFIQNEHTEVVNLIGKKNGVTSAALAYWNMESKKAFIDIKKIPVCPNGKDYQLWADINGEMINMGVLPKNVDGLYEIPFMESAESLNITLEKEGGSDHPDVSQLVMNGQV